MLNFNKPLELPPQLEWKFAAEPELLAWTIRARNYNTFVANCMFAFMAVLIMAWACFLHSPPGPDESALSAYLVSGCFYVVCLLAISSMTHQRINCAYRFTQSGLEHCEWKDFPEWALRFLKWLVVVVAILFVFMATIDPSFLLGALIGPGGTGLMYLYMANSKSYQAMQTHYHHYAFEWKELTRLALVTNREIVDLKYSVIQDGDDHVTNGGVNVFCKNKQKKTVAAFIENHLPPGVPFIKTKADVPQY